MISGDYFSVNHTWCHGVMWDLDIVGLEDGKCPNSTAINFELLYRDAC